jgi:predicted phosphoadenosine phosphosulfate sulfurtransferase
MKIYNKQNVLDAALERIRFLFDEFENVVVGFSGGKDSTVTLNLALQIAEEKNRLPLSVIFIDQEAEWQGTIDYIKKVMYDSRIKPMWFQIPMVITNNASSYNRYAYCWNEKEKNKWIHEQDPISIKENIYGTDRFHELFEAIFKVEFKNQKSCYLAGVRTEESPKRFVSLTDNLTYKWITWGKKLYQKYEHYTFYPIYDWSYTDVWKYIQSNEIEYNKVYDGMYQHGTKINDMRISNLHHETAIQVLLLVQEIEPNTWNKVVERIDGASSIKHIKNNSFACPKDLPYMFKDWKEYAYHLYDNIIQEDKYKQLLNKYINSTAKNNNLIFFNSFSEKLTISYWKKIIDTILCSDWDFTKINNFTISPNVYAARELFFKNYHKITIKQNLSNPYFEEKHFIELKQNCKYE